MRKNQYEEALFRCEDDRFELDMAIECSESAVQALANAAEDIARLDADGRERYRLDKGMVKPIHYRMVQKIYGALPGENSAIQSSELNNERLSPTLPLCCPNGNNTLKFTWQVSGGLKWWTC